MKENWLNKSRNKDLIVFFNGWGMDDRVVSHLKTDGYDVLTFCDYRKLNNINYDFGNYDKKILIAWSFGVYVCNYYYDNFKNFDKFTAINGTLKPIDDECGIPVKIFNLTVDNFNELSLGKFMKKISQTKNMADYCARGTSELKEELINIRDIKIKNYFNFDKVYISLNDRIIPYKNQKNYWSKAQVKIEELEGMHYIFDLYDKWSDLI